MTKVKCYVSVQVTYLLDNGILEKNFLMVNKLHKFLTTKIT